MAALARARGRLLGLGLSLVAVVSAATPALAEAAEGPTGGVVQLGVLGSEAVLGRTSFEPSTQASRPRGPDLAIDRGAALRLEIGSRQTRAGAIVIGALGLVGGAVVTSSALASGASPQVSLTSLVATPGDYPLFAAGATSLLAGFVLVRTSMSLAGRSVWGSGDRGRFILQPTIGLSINSVSVGVGGSF